MSKSDNKRSVKHRAMNIQMTHAGQLFLDAESELVFMEASLLCVVPSYTIVKIVTELAEIWKRRQMSKMSFQQEAMSDDQNLQQFLCLKRLRSILAAIWARV